MSDPEKNSVWTPLRRKSDALEVYLLGVVDFESAMILQDRLHYEIAQRDDGLGTLLICEHPLTVTTGRGGTILDLLADPREFESRQIGVNRVARNGGTILHGPGQVAAYPIIPVDRRWNGARPVEPNRAVADFVRKCTTAVCDMASELRVNASPTEDGAGAECRCGQFAWTGAAICDGVSSHGLFVNVSPDLLPFRLIRSARSVGSMSMQKMTPVPMPKVRESLMRNLADQFGYEDVHLYTRHPLLTRTTRKVVEYA
jgi:lipoyl(octanoyl) transferase